MRHLLLCVAALSGAALMCASCAPQSSVPSHPVSAPAVPPAQGQTNAPAQTTQSTAFQPQQLHELQLAGIFIDEDSLNYNGYEVSRLTKKVEYEGAGVPESSSSLIEVSYAVLKKNGRRLAVFEGVYFGMGNATDFGLFSFLGGEAKQLAVAQTIPRGGRHWVADLSSDGRIIFDSADYHVGREEFYVIDIDGDGVYEISLPITAFYMFEDMYIAETPLPDIIFKYDRKTRKYLPANPAFTNYVLRGIEDERRQLDPNEQTNYLSNRLDIVLRYVYAGREAEAWDFFETAYARPDAASMKKKIKAVLASDPVYQYLYRRRGGR